MQMALRKALKEAIQSERHNASRGLDPTLYEQFKKWERLQANGVPECAITYHMKAAGFEFDALARFNVGGLEAAVPALKESPAASERSHFLEILDSTWIDFWTGEDVKDNGCLPANCAAHLFKCGAVNHLLLLLGKLQKEDPNDPQRMRFVGVLSSNGKAEGNTQPVGRGADIPGLQEYDCFASPVSSVAKSVANHPSSYTLPFPPTSSPHLIESSQFVHDIFQQSMDKMKEIEDVIAKANSHTTLNTRSHSKNKKPSGALGG
jgi:hypothetical protein